MRTPLLAALLLTPTLHSQQPAPILPLPRITTDAEFTATITALDTELFHAYNRCADSAELARFSALFTDDVEFWHDQPNASTFGLPALTAATQKNICGKVTRELIPGSLRVFPMHGTGALEFGRHRFFHTGDPVSSGEADFVLLWLFRPGPTNSSAGGQWKLARVLSYDHNSAH